MEFLFTLIISNKIKYCLIILFVMGFIFKFSFADEKITENEDSLIIFVHGFRGDGVTTWKSDQEDFYWPEQIKNDPTFVIKKGKILTKFETLSFSYDSGCFLNVGKDITTISSYLLNELRKNKRYKNFYFIAHSMGGIVVKNLLLNLQTEDTDLLHKIKGFITISTPHLGVNDITEILRKECISPQAKDLNGEEGGYLDKLNDKWRNSYLRNPNTQSFFYAAAYELDPYRGQKIVMKNSAIEFANIFIGFNGNHFDVSKPKSLFDEKYTWTKQLIIQNGKINQDKKRIAYESELNNAYYGLKSSLSGIDYNELMKYRESKNNEDAVALLLTKIGKMSGEKNARKAIAAYFITIRDEKKANYYLKIPINFEFQKNIKQSAPLLIDWKINPENIKNYIRQ